MSRADVWIISGTQRGRGGDGRRGSSPQEKPTCRLPGFPYCFSLELLPHSLDGVSALGQQRLIQMLFGLLIGGLQRQTDEGHLGGTFEGTKGTLGA